MHYPDDVPTLTADGTVRLRALAHVDVPRIVEQCNDPESVEWTTVPQPYDDAVAREWIDEITPPGWREDRDFTFAIEHRGFFAGSISLRPRGPGEAEIGFGLHPEARGAGVMRRAIDLLLDWAFTARVLAVVHWRANVGNWASRRVVWAAGFTFGPTIPRLLDHRGERVDAWTAWIGADDPRKPTEQWWELPTLATPRLRLRPWGDSDADRLVEIANDPVFLRFIPDSPLPRTHDAVPAYLDRVRLSTVTGARFAWCLADRESDLALGNVALFDREGAAAVAGAEVGYWSHPEGRGRGLNSEALRRVAAWAFDPAGLGLARLHLRTAADNAASRRMAERAGFTCVGTLRSASLTPDGPGDSLLLDRLATDPAPDTHPAPDTEHRQD